MRRSARDFGAMTCASLALYACGARVVVGGEEPSDGGGQQGQQAGQQDAGTVSPTDGSGGAAAAGQTATVATDGVSVPPASESFWCQLLANPFGKDVDIVSIDATAPAARDVYLFSMPPSSGQTQPTPLTACANDPLGVQPFLYLSQGSRVAMTYPQPNMGYPLAAENLLMVRVHYLNAGDTTAKQSVSISITAAKPGTVTIHVGSILFRAQFPLVPAGTGAIVANNTSTPLDQGYSIFGSWSSMSPLGTDFQARANGTTFYEVKDPQAVFSPLSQNDPPVQVGVGQDLAWNCTYASPGLAQGDGQCMYQGFYFPADPKTPDRTVDAIPSGSGAAP
jgi:hypothetical protein